MQLDDITLPDDLLWINEFDWNPVEQNIERSLTGALLVQEQEKRFGRPIVLTGGDQAGWVSRIKVQELLTLSSMVNKKMMLGLPDARQFAVVFDRTNGSPVEASAILAEAYPSDSSLYSLTIRLRTTEMSNQAED